MSRLESRVLAQVVGRITRAPQLAHSAAGVPLCRFTVATEAGPASSPVVMPVYVKHALGVRCTRLGVGDLVRVRGEQRQRLRRRGGIEYPELATEADEVKLFERAARTA